MTPSRLAMVSAVSLMLATHAVADTLTFQQGDGGAYSTTDATYLNESTFNFGSSIVLTVVSGDVSALIRFPDIVGTDPGQVPPGSTIISASLTMTMYSVWNLYGITEIHEVYVDWVENTVYGFGFYALPGPHYGPAVGSILPNEPLGVTSGDMTSIVQNWADGDANRGVILRTELTPPPNDIYITQYFSDDASDMAWRPKLTVEFTPPTVPVASATWGGIKALYR